MSLANADLGRFEIFQDDLKFKEVTQTGDPVEMDARSVHQKQCAPFLHSTTLTVCHSKQIPQRFGRARAFSPVEGELIFYRRANQQGTQESFYLPTSPSADGTQYCVNTQRRMNALITEYQTGRQNFDKLMVSQNKPQSKDEACGFKLN